METRVRLLLIFAGLPEPRLQWRVGDEDGIGFRLDLAWPELRLAVEYDGRQHAEDASQWGRDIGRREWLDSHGWRLIVLRADDVYDDPWAAVLRVVAAMAQRGYEKQAAEPSLLFVEHFPGRGWKQRR